MVSVFIACKHSVLQEAWISAYNVDVLPCPFESNQWCFLADELDEWEALEVRPKQGRVQNLVYLNDEDEEEEGDDPEQDQESRKVMVST